MKLIEAMKDLKLISAKLDSNAKNLVKYSSGLSTEKPAMGDEKAQRGEIISLLQSSEDLAQRYVHLKTSINYTNLKTLVPMSDGKTYSIAELIIMKNSTLNDLKVIYDSVNDSTGAKRKAQISTKITTESRDVDIERYYDEKKMDEKKRMLLEFRFSIDGTLEVVNATTDLIEEIA